MGCVNSTARRASAISRQKLNFLLPKCYNNYKELVNELEKMMQYREATIQQMNSVADKLDERHRDVNIAKLVGSSAGVVGAAITGFGIVLAPFTLGASAAVAVAGGMALAAGTATATGAHVCEKVLENEYLSKVQKTVDRDKEQCEKVQRLWKGFEDYCSEIVQTIELANPTGDQDIRSLKTWVLAAVKETKSTVAVIFEAFRAIDEELSKRTGSELRNETTNGPTMEKFLITLITKAKEIAKNGNGAFLMSNIKKVTGVEAFLLICAIGLGNLFVLITTSIDVHKGSLSKAAQDIREKSSQLQEEYSTWKEAFADFK